MRHEKSVGRVKPLGLVAMFPLRGASFDRKSRVMTVTLNRKVYPTEEWFGPRSRIRWGYRRHWFLPWKKDKVCVWFCVTIPSGVSFREDVPDVVVVLKRIALADENAFGKYKDELYGLVGDMTVWISK